MIQITNIEKNRGKCVITGKVLNQEDWIDNLIGALQGIFESNSCMVSDNLRRDLHINGNNEEISDFSISQNC